MAGFGERLWDMGKSPGELLSLLVFGLVALLTGFIANSIVTSVGGAGLELVAFVLTGVGGFFVTLALFLGAYTASGDSWTTTVWKVAQLLGAVFVLLAIF